MRFFLFSFSVFYIQEWVCYRIRWDQIFRLSYKVISVPFLALSATATGIGILAQVSPAFLRIISKKIVGKFIGIGKVAYPRGRTPEVSEIKTAEFLAEKQSASIYIVGGNGRKGADFFLNGRRWESKSLTAGTDTAVSNRLRDGVKQSTRIIIDGRDTGLTREIFISGLNRANRNGAYPDQVKVILRDGTIFDWP